MGSLESTNFGPTVSIIRFYIFLLLRHRTFQFSRSELMSRLSPVSRPIAVLCHGTGKCG